MKTNVPFPDEPESAAVVFEDTLRVKPGDILRVENNHGKIATEYKILSVRNDSSGVVAHESPEDGISVISKQELRELVTSDDVHRWTILFRANARTRGGDETAVISIYAVGTPDPQSTKALAVEWAFTSQQTLRHLPESDGLLVHNRFANLRASLCSGDIEAKGELITGDFSTLHTRTLSRSEQFAHMCVSAAEYNAHRLFSLPGEPTYDAHTKELLLDRLQDDS